MRKATDYTYRMKELFRKKTEGLTGLYSRENYERALTRYKRGRKDAKPFLLADLERMCSEGNVDIKKLLKDPTYLQTIPTRGELEDKLLDIFHALYREVPSPARYMQRIVHRLAPEYSQDPVRVTILKKYVLGGGIRWQHGYHTDEEYTTGAILAWAAERMTAAEKAALDCLPENARLRCLVNKLEDGIFEEHLSNASLPAGRILALIAGRWERLPELDIIFLKNDPEENEQLFAWLCGHFAIPAEGSRFSRLLELAAACTEQSEESLGVQYMMETHPEAWKAAVEYEERLTAEMRRIEQLADENDLGKKDPLRSILSRYPDTYRENKEKIAGALLRKTHRELTVQKEGCERLMDTVIAFIRYLHTLAGAWGAFRTATDALRLQLGLDMAPMGNLLVTLAEHGAEAETAPVEAMESAFKSLLKLVFYRSARNTEKSALTLFADELDYEKTKRARDWSLLAVCNELAQGYFKTGGKTRKNLLRFAIMFDMTIAVRETDKRDEVRDVEKNLFEDYYCDNLIRFLSADYADPRLASGLEQEPSGEGINFKNFAEAIYVYYLYRKDLPLTPGERIDEAEALIKSCKAKGSAPGGDMLDRGVHTQEYRERFLERILGAADKKELQHLILKNYHIAGGGSPILYASETNTAYDFFQETIEEIEAGSAYSVDAPDGYEDEADRVSELMEELACASDLSFTWKLAPLLEKKYAGETEFLRLVRHLDKRLTAELDWIGVRRIHQMSHMLHILYHTTDADKGIRQETLKAQMQESDISVTGGVIDDCLELLQKLGFDVKRVALRGESWFYLGKRSYGHPLQDQIMQRLTTRACIKVDVLRELFTRLLKERYYRNRRVTRTTFIAVYVLKYISLLADTCSLESFAELCEDFDWSISPELERARFQPLQEKNILDMYVLLSIYYYLLENGQR